MFLPGVPPFAVSPGDKTAYLEPQLRSLLAHHRKACEPYARLVDAWERRRGDGPLSVEDYPYLPVTIFKEYLLRSTTAEVMNVRSSATTSGTASNILVDKATRKNQSLSANKVLADFIGPEQRPYLVFDVETSVRGSEAMSARGAAIMSLAHLASEFLFVMQDNGGSLVLDHDALQRALGRIGDRPFIAYGFTYLLYGAHRELAATGFQHAAHPAAVLLHSGGWKRLIDLAVDKQTFNATVSGPWGLSPDRVVDFYGSVEQVGVPYPDCEAGVKHVPYWADIVIRRADTLEAASVGETGLIQLLNCLPLSAPNHSVLTEDLGAITTEDGCVCGRRGKAFVFRGRAPKAELRGCSDVPR